MKAVSRITWLLLLAAAGCATPQSSSDYQQYLETSVSPPALRETASPVGVEEPVTLSASLTLEAALAAAELTHPDLLRARAEVDAAAARLDASGRLPNPVAVGRMESAPFDGDTTGEAEYVAGVSQRIPLGGRLGATGRIQARERDRASSLYEARRREIRAGVHGAFAAALYAERVVATLASAVNIAETGATIARARVAAGDAIPGEEARSDLERIRASLELERARALREQATLALAAAIGSPGTPIASLDGALDSTLEIPAIESIAAALDASPEIEAARAVIATLQARAELADAERVPDVDLDLFYRRLEGENRNSFDVGIGIAFPLFDSGKARVRAARAEIAVAEADARTRRAELERRVREAHFRLSAAIRAARIMESEVLPRAETVLRGAESRYRAGDASLAEMLPLRRDRTAFELGHLETLRDVRVAWADLSAYLGLK